MMEAVKILKQLLSQPLFTLPVSATLNQAAALMGEQHLSSLLVVEHNEPAGIVTERDILRALAQGLNPNQVITAIMTTPVISAPADTEFRDGYHLLALHNIRHLLVTDALGAPAGIISESDFRNQLSASFISRLRDVRGVMSSHTLALPEDTPLQVALQAMATHRHSCVIATCDACPSGILTEYDAVRLFKQGQNQAVLLRDVMQTPVKTVPQNTTVPEALSQLKRYNIRHLVVVDELNQVIGMVTEHDIVLQIEIEFAGDMRNQRDETRSVLKRYETQLHAIFETTNIFLALLDPDGNILEINSAALKLAGMRREQVINKPMWQTVWRSDDPAQSRNLRQMIENTRAGKTGQLDTEHTTPLGQLHLCDCRFRPIYDNSDTPQYILVEGLDITRLKDSQKKLKHLAFYDPLTSLPNRTHLTERMATTMEHCRQNDQLLAIAYLDLDHFKPVNDNLGHKIGDQLLIEVAKRLKNTSRHWDTVSRLGGDEFVILLPGLSTQEQACEVVQRILTAVCAPYTIQEHTLILSASIGVTLYPLDNVDADMLLRHADQAMYKAKQLGRNQYYLFDEQASNAINAHASNIRRIREALDQKELVLHYQPKVDMDTGQVIGVEALLRWQHPEKGLLYPLSFLPEIQNDRVMLEVDNWVLEEGLRQLNQWHRQGLALTMSINISTQQMQHVDFVDQLKTLLGSYPLSIAEHLELEVLESAALENIDTAAEVMRHCQALGVGFALDDFGTGYSCLTHLKRLPANTIKIDRSFINDILNDPDDLAIVEGIIGLASAFRLTTVAEGVETTEQGIMLQELGCKQAQGFGIAKPMPASEIPAWITRYTPAAAWHRVEQAHATAKNYPLLAASVDHRNWVARIVDYVESDGATKLPPSIADHRACRFSTWLYGEGQAHFANQERWQTVDSIHRAVHTQSARMMALMAEGQVDAARNEVPSLLKKRDNLLALLAPWYPEAE